MAALARTGPFRPDHRHENIGLRQLALDVLTKIGSEWNAVDIHKHGFLAEMVGETVPDAARNRIRIGAAV
jgi:hypothetical protein